MMLGEGLSHPFNTDPVDVFDAMRHMTVLGVSGRGCRYIALRERLFVF
jgi:hypothetical protein